MTVLQKMQADVILQNFGHQAIDSASHRSQLHEHLSTVMIVCAQLSLHSFHLTANALHSVLDLRSLPIRVGHFISY